MARRIDPELVAFLYTAGYSQGDIAFIYDSVSGHISKVLKAAGVPARARGVKAVPTPLKELPKDIKTKIDAEGLRLRFIEWETIKREGKPLTSRKKAKSKEDVKRSSKADSKEVAAKKIVPGDVLPVERLDKACLKLMAILGTQTPLKRLKFTQRPVCKDSKLVKGERVCELVSKGKITRGLGVIQSFAEKLEKRANESYPTLIFHITVDDRGVVIRCRNK